MKKQMSEFAVYCLKYAESTLPENMVFAGGDKNKKLPISFAVYLIRLKNKNILIDTGCDTMPGFKMKRFYSPAFVLRELDITSDEITDVVITHAHHDHIGAIKHFKNAVIHINKDALDSQSRYITDDMTVETFLDEYVIAPEIRVITRGGHAAGSSIVEIVSDGIIHILAGDECYTNDNIEKTLCTGAFFNKDRATEFVETYSDKKFLVHTCHDISLKTEKII